ncbi:hypothetical protein FRX31_003052, partial [Thalictrum thalictroides]
ANIECGSSSPSARFDRFLCSLPDIGNNSYVVHLDNSTENWRQQKSISSQESDMPVLNPYHRVLKDANVYFHA